MKTLLYVGLRPPAYIAGYEILHCPLITIHPLAISPLIWKKWDSYTHLILTSRVASGLFLKEARRQGVILEGKGYICLGKATAEPFLQEKLCFDLAPQESQEGVIAYLRAKNLDPGSYFFLPRSSLARQEIDRYLKEKGYLFDVYPLYETKTRHVSSLPDLNKVDAIFFTSPSTVRAFKELFGNIPQDKLLFYQGSITQAAAISI